MITDTKEFTFDCAHQLVGYDGKCKNIHGHTYKLQVTVEGPIINDCRDCKNGMIVDFTDLKDLVKTFILDNFDHAFIACGDEPILQSLIDNNYAVLILNRRTTCENMVQYMGEKLNNIVKKTSQSYDIQSVKLWETPTSFSEWRNV